MTSQLRSSQVLNRADFRIPHPAASELGFVPTSLPFPFKVPIAESTKPICQGSLPECVPVTPLHC